jgi:hypothetical protein
LLLAGAAALWSGCAGAAWREVRFPGRAANRFTVDGEAVRITSDSAVSVLWRDVAVDLAATPILAWRWRIDAAPPPTTLVRRGGDDRALALYATFAADPATETLGTRLRRAMLEPFVEGAMPGRVLAFVWGGDGATVGWFVNPYLAESGRMRVLRGPEAPLGVWLDEAVDLRAEHAAAFGEPARTLLQLGISADTDDTASHAEGTLELLGFRSA